MTEIALVADLHGNLPAVEALDQDLRKVIDLGAAGNV